MSSSIGQKGGIASLKPKLSFQILFHSFEEESEQNGKSEFDVRHNHTDDKVQCAMCQLKSASLLIQLPGLASAKALQQQAQV